MTQNTFDIPGPGATCLCPCGRHSSLEAHRGEIESAHTPDAWEGTENQIDRLVERAVLHAAIPDRPTRRAFLNAVGASTALAALSEAFPVGTAKALAQQAGPLEKPALKIGYVPITCTVPMLLAQAMGEYGQEGLDVNLVRTPGWAIVRDKLTSQEFDASHLVLGMPMTISLGIGAPTMPLRVAAVQNINGNAITLHLKHKDNRDPKSWKGFKFGIPHEHSMHAMLLRYYLADAGLDPDKDVELRVYAPPDSVANMAAGNLDGMLFAEPWGQRAVFEGIGFLHLLTRDIFPDHPCCTLSVSEAFIAGHPNTYGALFRSVVRAADFANKKENRLKVAELLAPAAYLNQPRTVLEQVLTGRYADGLGNVVRTDERIGFDPFPYEGTAIWLLTQLRRWKIIASDIDYAAVAKKVFDSTGAARQMEAMGRVAPAATMRTHTILGKTFDPYHPDDYLKSFAIRRT